MNSKPLSDAPRQPPLDNDGRALAKRWIDNWKVVGPLLERERWDRVKALTDEEAARDALDLFDCWSPDWPAGDGEELLLHQRVFTRARRG
jgi:hypothetical protein